MSGKKPQRRRNRPAEGRSRPEAGHENDVRLSPMAKDGDKLLKAVNSGNMVGILSKNEIMYLFIYHDQYQCFIHPLDAEEGRRKSFPMDERNTAMMKNLASVADQVFEIVPQEDMNPIGVMVAAERGIIAYLDMTGQLPVDDVDFMQWQQKSEDDEKKGG